jgi:acetyl esterase/lipase
MESIRIAYGPGEWQFGELRAPAGTGSHPVALIIHGGFWRARYGLDLMDRMAEDFAARGIAAWNIEYRRVGQEGGGWPGTLADVALAADHLRALAPTHHLALNQVVAIGHSAGGHLALWLAGRHRLPAGSPLATAQPPLPLRGAIALAGVCDLEQMWQIRHDGPEDNPVDALMEGAPSKHPDRYAQASPSRVLPLGIPQVLVHGTADPIVPIAVSGRYCEAARAAGDSVELIALPGMEHFAVIDPTSEAWPPIAGAMERLVKG